MFGDGSLTFREFATREPLPLATIHDAMLEFLRGRTDAVLYGAHAVNAYVDEPRMTDDVDVMSMRAANLAEEVGTFLRQRFHIAVRVRRLGEGMGHRVLQVRKPSDRRLVDVRLVRTLPPHQTVEGLFVLAPVELICSKVVSMARRSMTPGAFMDLADLRRLLLAFPELKTEKGAVADRLKSAGAADQVLAAWRDAVAQEIHPTDEADEFAPWDEVNE
jgi:hypothetical protein